MKNLTLREKIGQMLIIKIQGKEITNETKRMIEEYKNGNVDIVLCKTQARFARDMELVEKYIHNLFHEWNVRFIQR